MSPADARAFLAGCFGQAGGEPIAASAEARPRLARVLGAGTVGGEGGSWIEQLLTAEDVPTRAAAAHAMDIMGEAALGLAEEILAGEFDARVQLQLVELLAARVDVTEGRARRPGAPVLALVEAPRGGLQRAGPRGGGRGPRSARPRPGGRRADRSSRAAPGLRCDHRRRRLGTDPRGAALEPLKALLAARHGSSGRRVPRARAALPADCVPPLLAALTDEHSCVMETAHRALLAFSGRRNGHRARGLAGVVGEERQAGHLPDQARAADLDKRYGYG